MRILSKFIKKNLQKLVAFAVTLSMTNYTLYVEKKIGKIFKANDSVVPILRSTLRNLFLSNFRDVHNSVRAVSLGHNHSPRARSAVQNART